MTPIGIHITELPTNRLISRRDGRVDATVDPQTSFDQDLLFLFQLFHDGQGNIQRLGHDGGRG